MTTHDWYDARAPELAAAWDAVAPLDVHGCWVWGWVGAIPQPIVGRVAPLRILDVGAGSGRDARWFADRGGVVTAVEPCGALLAHAMRQPHQAGVVYVQDALPKLQRVAGEYDLILLSAVWKHVGDADAQAVALARLSELLSARGSVVITLRLGPPVEGRGDHPVSASALLNVARSLGLEAWERPDPAASVDVLGRPDVSWTRVVVRHAGASRW